MAEAAAATSSVTSQPPEVKVEIKQPRAQSKAHLTSIPETNCWMALLVTFCFSPPIGVFAIYFSLSSAAAYRDGHKQKGAYRAFISIVLSMIGIMITMLILSAVVGCITLNRGSQNKCFGLWW